MKNLFKKDKNTETSAVDAEKSVVPEGVNGNNASAKSKLKLDKRMILIICAACLAFVCVVLAIVLPICLTGGEGEYFKLKYDIPDGVIIEIENEDGAGISSGWEVKGGVNVSFKLAYEAEHEGIPEVEINGKTVKANGEGVYSFTMNSDTTIKVTGVFVKREYQVTFDGGADGWVRYSSADYDLSKPISVRGGVQVTFDVSVSVYYKQSGYTVLANTVVVKPDEQGHYTFTVIGKTTVSVINLKQEDPFSARERENGTLYTDGDGTRANPYRIRKPIDLYAMADLIGNEFYAGANYQMAYYRLEEDIDMEGERLYIIGDGFSTSSSVFAGNFDGNNKTISNYYIADEIIEQSAFTKVFTPFLGLFGVATATNYGAAEIYDLNLKDFKMEISHADKTAFFAGGLVGMGSGAAITNCSVQGEIIAYAGEDPYRVTLGGVVGYLNSAVTNSGSSIPAYIRSCSADVRIDGRAGFIESIGGVVGNLYSYDALTPAYVLNSYSTGDVNGAIRTGGIVGSLNEYSSVKNCYATGIVEAKNEALGIIDDSVSNAYAGGIAGYAEYGAIISDSFSVCEIYASAIKGAAYEITDGIAAYVKTSGAIPAGAYHALVLNSYSKAKTVYGKQESNINDGLIQNTLLWDNVDWTFSGQPGEYPSVNKQIVSKTFTITVNFGNTHTVGGSRDYSRRLTDVYSDMAGLYGGVYVGNNIVSIDQYLDSDTAGYRTYGYYFDADHTQRIPNSYVPTRDMTIYAEFVNYNEVAGRYYVQNGVNGSASYIDYQYNNQNGTVTYGVKTPMGKSAYVELDLKGNLIYRNGVISNKATYYYNGESLILEGVYVFFEDTQTGVDAETQQPEVMSETYYLNLIAVKNGVNLDMYNGSVYSSSKPLKAIKQLNGFNYGYYYSGNTTYLFNPDMTGVRTEGTTTTNFNYSVNGNTINTDGVGNLSLSSLTAFDPYFGTWEKSAGSNKQYTFDGKGGYTYEEFGYKANGEKQVYNSAKGSYTSGLVGGKPIKIENDLLVIDGETYYKKGSFVGSWRYPDARQNAVPIDIHFGGISALGYGGAVIDYGDYYGKVNVEYHAINAADGTITIELYNGDYLFGSLVYFPVERTLSGSIISASANTTGSPTMIDNAKFFLFDDFMGSWVSNENGLELINFNGFGNYDFEGTSAHHVVKGEITINGVSAGAYTLENGKLVGSFSYNGTNYAIRFDESLKLVIVTPDGGSAIKLFGLDGWEKITLEAADGTQYSFNGHGNVTEGTKTGGTVTITHASGTATESKYTLSNGMPVIGGNTLTAGDGKYTLGGASLWVKTDFATVDKWYYKDGREIKELTVGRIGPKDGGFVVDAITYDGKTVNGAVYDLEHNEIYVVDADGNITLTLSVMKITSADINETSLAFEVLENNQARNFVCITEFDEYKGEYKSASNKKVVFDGFGASVYATGEVVEYNALNEEVFAYTYEIEGDELKLTHTEVTATGFIIDDYVFKAGAQTEDAYVMNGKYYTIVKVDALYNLEAFKRGSFNTVDQSVKYVFDGIGTLTETVVSTGAEKTYNYRIMGSYDTLLMTYTLYVTDESGQIYAGELNLSSTNSLRLSERDRFYGLTVYGVDKEGNVDKTAKYSFNGNVSGPLNYVKGEDVTTYNYKLIEDNGNVCKFEITLPNDQSKKYEGTLKFVINEYTQDEKDREYWTLALKEIKG
ncbi:MAG: hypothetical protein K2L67_05250 [Clostridia bacterium]|nr:hypothetical protein [Clostridia bacterium]